MVRTVCVSLILLAHLTGCAVPARESSTLSSSHTLRFEQPPEKAARCFARNAEDHSSALVAEVKTRGESAHVIVRVKNGVTYATADFQRAGSGSRGTLTLNVSTTGRTSDLVASLVEGC